jgi:hypothetical protein
MQAEEEKRTGVLHVTCVCVGCFHLMAFQRVKEMGCPLSWN